MAETKKERIVQIDRQIIALILDRNRATRRNNWLEEERITTEIDKLELEIKQIKAE